MYGAISDKDRVAILPTQTPPPADDTASAGPAVLEAVEDQLRIKLKATRAAVSVLVIDRVQWPGEN